MILVCPKGSNLQVLQLMINSSSISASHHLISNYEARDVAGPVWDSPSGNG